jgi:exodeoxyribonuclease V beta subunit
MTASRVAARTGRLVPRPEILRSIPLDRNVVIDASAGTGKTFTLEHLVVELLLTTDLTLDRILVVTFTEKATNELRMRLRAKLEEVVSGQDAPTPAAVDAGDFWEIDAAARGRLEHALRLFDAATITTIHAFCQRVLRENAFFGGRLFEEQQVDGRDAFARAMREAFRRDVARDAGRSCWLEAALRSGWSIDRIESLLWDCVQSRGDLRPVLDPVALERALAKFPIDDARKAIGAVEMGRWGIHTATAKAVARRLYDLAELVERALVSRSVPAYVIEAQEIGFSYLNDKLPASPPTVSPTGRLCAAALELGRLTPTFSAGLAQMILPAVRDELTRRKREAGQYDFDDMLALVDEALRGPGADALALQMRDRWRYVLIDEFQDTDETQWSIFRRAFFARSDGASVLCLVGDPKQSIYRFRGADVDTYLRARGDVVLAGGRRVPLDRNYRSTRAVVDATNAIFDQTAPAPIFSGALDYTPVTCGRPDRTLVDAAGHAVSPVHVLRFCAPVDSRSLSALGERMAREAQAITDPSNPWRFDGRPLRHSDIFVLTRNAREGRTISAALRAGGVPYAFYKQDGLFQTDEAKEVRALLLAIDDPNDRGRRLAAWLTPFFGLPLSAIERARDVPTTHPLASRLFSWKALADARDFDRLFESIVQSSGVVKREIFFGDGERELTNYLHVFELLLEHAHRSHATLRELVHALSGLIDETRLPLDLEGNVQRLESDRQAVQIMTIHKCKGLEAPIVFVAGGFSHSRGDDVRIFHEDGRRLGWIGPMSDPKVEGLAKAEEREEEQRLMYVALTRAMGRMYLPCATDDGGEAKSLRGPYNVISRRVAELLRSGEIGFSVEDVPVAKQPEFLAPPPPEKAQHWQPPQELLREENDGGRVEQLRRRSAGAFMTSYTRMKSERAEDRSVRSEGTIEPKDFSSDSQLRGARSSGVFLHELLERLPLASFETNTTLDVWRSRGDVSSLFDEAMAAHRVERSQRQHAEQLVWAAYTTPLSLPGRRHIARIASASRIVREMDFVFPIPDAAETTPPLRRVHAYVRGSIDLAFDHDGVTYFVDWKSDSLASYVPDKLAHHVNAHYESQAQLYAVAIVKLLGVKTEKEYEARFGGMLYCFLRGLDHDGSGLWSARPSWDQVRAWEGGLYPPRRSPIGTSP